MVLESIIKKKNIRRHPILIFFITLLICFGSIFFADVMFPNQSSILSVAFITIGLVPLVYNVLSDEEVDEASTRKNFTTFFARHFNLIMLFVWIFIGVIVAFTIYYVVSPPEMRSLLFEEQIRNFCSISGTGNCAEGIPFSISKITGQFSGVAAFNFDACLSDNSTVTSCTWLIFANNFKVLLFTIVLSVLYGVGAIFMIVWNASILGVFFGELLLMGNLEKAAGLFQGMLLGHGPPELLAYVFGALAGAILSAMIARGEFLKSEESIIIKDVLFLSALAIFSVAYGAVTEAVGILKMNELYFILGVLYLLVIIVAVMLYGKTRSLPHLGF
ncbi:MAG: stage II sporulation protein M [archaeon]